MTNREFDEVMHDVRREVLQWEYERWCRGEGLDPDDQRTMVAYEEWFATEKAVHDWYMKDYYQ